MPRRNHKKGRRPQASRRQDGSVARRTAPPPPLQHLVIPKGRCILPHRKLQFSKDEAETALKQARARRERLGQAYNEERIYHCEPGCGKWHLTSRKTYQRRDS